MKIVHMETGRSMENLVDQRIIIMMMMLILHILQPYILFYSHLFYLYINFILFYHRIYYIIIIIIIYITVA